MKLIIDIPKELKSAVYNCGLFLNPTEKVSLIDAINNGTPISDNATNGEVIRAMFPDAEIHIDGNDVFFHHIGFWIKCNIRWWNAPYQKGGK